MRYEIQQTKCFAEWQRALRDFRAQNQINARVLRLKSGNFGDCKTVGEGVRELRLHHGPGYRIYFGITGKYIILLLCGGDKSSQERDIILAKKIFEEVKKDERRNISI